MGRVAPQGTVKEPHCRFPPRRACALPTHALADITCVCTQGSALLGGSNDCTAWLWDATRGNCVQVYAGHEAPVTQGCFGPKKGKVRAALRHRTRHACTSPVTCRRLPSNPMAQVVCTGSADGTVRVWARDTAECKHTFRGYDTAPRVCECADVLCRSPLHTRVASLAVPCRHGWHERESQIVALAVHPKVSVVLPRGSKPPATCAHPCCRTTGRATRRAAETTAADGLHRRHRTAVQHRQRQGHGGVPPRPKAGPSPCRCLH